MIRVLFVCTGNICRSPMAEGVFQDRVNKAGLSDKIQSDSASTGDWHVGERAHPGTLKIFEKYQIAYNGRARQVTFADLDDFDYVLAMDDSHLKHLQRMASGTKADVSMFLSYANQAGTVSEKEVPDPYYTGEFDRVYGLVLKGSQALLDRIRKERKF